MTDERTPTPAAGPPPGGPVPGDAASWLFGALIGAVVVGLIIAAWLAGKDEGKRDAQRHGQPATRTAAARPVAASGPGKALFVAKCSSCHTLQAAGAKGAVGPNLDSLKPGAAQVLAALENGGTGSGSMPQGLYSGTQAKQVADFVTAATGGG